MMKRRRIVSLGGAAGAARKLFLIAIALVVVLGLKANVNAATYYQTTKADVPIRSSYSASASPVTTVPSGYVLKIKGQKTNDQGNVWYQIESGSYNNKSLANAWVYSGNVTTHTHNCSSNGGLCRSSGCGYTYGYTVTSISGLYQGANSSGATMWSIPYSTGKATQKGTVAYNQVVQVNGKTTNYDKKVWYRLTNGYWVYSENLKAHSHNCSNNGGKCKYSGCTYTYSCSVSSASGYYQVTASGGATTWSIPYSTGSAVQKGTIAYNSVVQINGKTTNYDGNVWYRLTNGYWVYSGNVKAHSHDCSSNGGKCKYSGCGYTYSYSTTSLSGYYEGTVSSGAKMWSIPYSTGSAVQQGTLAYKSVVQVTGKTTNYDGNVWYKLSNGSWIYSENVKKHTHDYSNNGGVCKYSGCGYTYPLSTTSLSGTYMATNSGGAKIWSLPYSTGKSSNVRTASVNSVMTVTAKAKNADGNIWYKLSDGNWVYSGNVTKAYAIRYNANPTGQSAMPPTQYKAEGKSVTITSTIPTRTSYIFQYWNTKSDGSGDKYIPGQTKYSKNADVTLYAIWKQCTSHSYYGGICSKCGYSYTLIIEDMNAPFIVTSTAGANIWNRPYADNSKLIRTDATGKVLFVVAKTKNQKGNLWYKLSDGNWVYSENVTRAYEIAYSLGGGTNNNANPRYVCAGNTVSLLSPTRSGYIFAGWYTSDGKRVYSLTMKSDITVYAYWTEIPQDVDPGQDSSEPLDQPDLSLSTDETAGTINLSWSPVSGATEYIVYRTTEGSDYSQQIAVTTGSSYVDDEVTPGGTYYYFVVASDPNDGRSSQSDQESIECQSDNTEEPYDPIDEPVARTNLSKATVTGIKNKTYTGKAIKQSITVTLNGKTLKAGTDYTVTYQNNVKVGTAILIIKGSGNYTGSIKKTFKITKASDQPADASYTRLYGADRYATSLKIADAYKKALGVSKFSTICVADGQNYPDALAGAYFAYINKAPIIDVRQNAPDGQQTMNAINYIKKNLKKGGKIYVLGGPGSVPNSVVSKLKAAGFSVTRLWGQNRYLSNLAILEAAGIKNGTEYIVTTGTDFRDALSASATGKPVLLVAGNSLTADQKAYLAGAGAKKFTIVGTTKEVSASIEKQLKKYAPVTRLSGNTPYVRSLQIAKKYFTGDVANINIADGRNFPDALCAGPLARKKGGPLFLTDGSSEVDYKIYTYTKAANTKKATIYGGPASVSNATAKYILGID